MLEREQLIGDAQEVGCFIDVKRLRLLGRSPEALLAARRCSQCRARLAAASRTPSAETHIREIVRCCSKKEEFVTTEMPLREIAFRILLAGGNRPVSLRQLHHQVTEDWASPSNPKSLSLEALQHILAVDRYYGFALTSQESDQGD